MRLFRPLSHAHLIVEPQTLLAVAEVADTRWNRLVGLLGRQSLAPGTALVLDPCSLVHTWFMSFAIDLVFLDRESRVVRCVSHVAPFRIAWGGWRAHTTVELPAGTLDSTPVSQGSRVRIEPI